MKNHVVEIILFVCVLGLMVCFVIATSPKHSDNIKPVDQRYRVESLDTGTYDRVLIVTDKKTGKKYMVSSGGGTIEITE